MKSTGITRAVDKLGRIVIPKEIRQAFDIKSNIDSVEVFTEGSTIVLKKYEPACTFCHEAKDIVSFKEKNICPACLKKLSEMSQD